MNVAIHSTLYTLLQQTKVLLISFYKLSNTLAYHQKMDRQLE